MFRPRSILQLVLFSFVVVLSPVVGALIYGGQTLTHIVRDQRQHLEEVAYNTEFSQSVGNGLLDLERLARQYQLLANDSFLKLFNQVADSLRADLDGFRARYAQTGLASDAEILAHRIEALSAALNGVSEEGSKKTKPSKKSAENLSSSRLITELNESLMTLREHIRLDLQNKVNHAKDKAQDTQTTLLVLGLTIIPSSLILIGLFSLLITRPIRDIDRSIQEIGTGIYQGRASSIGPKDLEIVAQRLIWLKQRLHSSEESQERFLRHISHELKTPLASIKEGVELLADEVPGPLTPQQGEVLAILQRGTQHFQVLINNLLDFNLLRGNQVLHREHVDFKVFLQAVSQPYRPLLQRKNLRIESLGDDVTLRVDRSMFSAALDNLISNAIHFSPQAGKIFLQWTVSERGFVLLVGDEGKGVDASETEKIFLPFYQGKTLRDGPVKGTGLGLSIARECMEAHRGTIKLIEAQRGAWFELCLPKDSVVLN